MDQRSAYNSDYYAGADFYLMLTALVVVGSFALYLIWRKRTPARYLEALRARLLVWSWVVRWAGKREWLRLRLVDQAFGCCVLRFNDADRARTIQGELDTEVVQQQGTG